MTPCLSFDRNAEEAVKFYISVFKKNSKILHISYYAEGAHRPKGALLAILFRLNGQEFLALNGGPEFKFNQAISMMVNCKTQAEIDRLWDKLSKGGKRIQCGWLKDKYGVSWQIVPEKVIQMISDPDQKKADRVMQAVWKMTKLDIRTLEKAYKGTRRA